jgi:pimeloyl-ACP methyl ester carboxylesterase
MRTLLLAMLIAFPAAAQAPMAQDPPHDVAHPARMEVLHIPSDGVAINGVAYLAAGPGPHPTLVIAHGWPGNEKNLDLAQAVRRAGWNAITFNYRGSWGSPGSFRFAQVPQDTAAVLAYLRDPAVTGTLGIDPARLVLAGHSMGGWATALTAGKDSGLKGAILISAANMGSIGTLPRAAVVQAAAGTTETLADTSPEIMADELIAGAAANDFRASAAGLAKHPLLVLTSDDGLAPGADALAAAVRTAGGQVTSFHATTDHSWSDARIALQTQVIGWLQGLR